MYEEDLLRRIAEEDLEALEELYSMTSRAVFGYIYSIVDNAYDAEDIMQDTYLKIRAAAHLYTPQGKPMAWILTIAKNLSYMRLRESNNRKECSFEEISNFKQSTTPTTNESKSIIEQALKRLQKDEKEIIILHIYSGMKHREIAELLNKPLPTVLSKYSRGLKKMKKELCGKEYAV